MTIPIEYICPITGSIMNEPVICGDGHTYEKYAIEEWLKKDKTSPITRREISTNLISNRNLKKLIEEFKNNKETITNTNDNEETSNNEETITSNEETITSNEETNEETISDTIYEAAGRGDLEMVKWFYNNNKTNGCTDLAMAYACEKGRLNVVRMVT